MDKTTAYNHFTAMLTAARREADDIQLDGRVFKPDSAYPIHVTMLLLANKLENYLKTEADEEFKERFLC